MFLIFEAPNNGELFTVENVKKILCKNLLALENEF